MKNKPTHSKSLSNIGLDLLRMAFEGKVPMECAICLKEKLLTVDIVCGKHIDQVCKECGVEYKRIRDFMRSRVKYTSPKIQKMFKDLGKMDEK